MTQGNTAKCVRADIGAYLDGELSLTRELAIEEHLSECPECKSEVDVQKLFLAEIESSLASEAPLELPVDFARVVITRAESSVDGLRKPKELSSFLLICAFVLLLIVLVSGAEIGNLMDRSFTFAERMGAVADVFAHLIYSFLLGIGVFLKFIAAGSGNGLAIPLTAAVLIVSSLMVWKRLLRPGRA